MGLNSPDYLHTSAEAVKLAMGDREKYLGDMDYIKIPYDGLLSKDYARERRKLIDPAKASLELRPGSPEKFADSSPLDRPVHEVLDGDARHDGDTSYIAVVDKDRNMVSFEPSLHDLFGTGVVMGNTASSSTVAATTTRWFVVKRTPSNPASARAARCRARWS